MKTLYIYDSEGTSEEEINFECNVFRKVLNLDDPSHMTEYEIALKIYENPQPNLVHIFDVVKTEYSCYYDMEVLDDRYRLYKEYKEQLEAALHQLHSLNVVYIDVKSDNVGFSTRHNRFKLLDFDCSGIVDVQDKKKWLRKPIHAYMYKKLIHLEATIDSLLDLDDYAVKQCYKV
jgi:hypothetical protein